MSSQPTFFQRYQFWFLLLAALFIRQAPMISLPLNWLESYFHELSHGIAAIMSGGSVKRIELFVNGAGLCTTFGGSRFFTSFMGYAGASLWGALIYQLSNLSVRLSAILSGLLCTVILLSIVLWVRDLLTLIICIILAVLCILPLKFRQLNTVQVLLKFIGISVLLNSVYSPSYLLDGRALGDGAALAQLTMIPEAIWVLIWFAISIGLLMVLAKIKVKKSTI